MLREPSRVVAREGIRITARVQILRCVTSSLKVFWYGSMKWSTEENFGVKWKIFSCK